MPWPSSPPRHAEIAAQALDLIEVEYEPQPVVSDPVQARQPDVPALHPNGNLLKHIKVRKGEMEQGFAEADVILEHTFHTATTDHAFLEPECSIARPTPDGRMEIYVGSQIPYRTATRWRAPGLARRARAHHRAADGRRLWRQGRHRRADPRRPAGERHRSAGQAAL